MDPGGAPTAAVVVGRLIAATHSHDLVVIGHHRMPLLDTVVWGNVTPVVVREAVGDVAVVPADPGRDRDA